MSLKEKLENNRKIIRRFQFDLKIGVFHSENDHNIYNFIVAQNNEKYTKFIRILEKLGYKHTKTSRINEFGLIRIFYGITIDAYFKTYTDYYIISANVNLPPDYILGYIEHPVLDTINERLGFKHG